MAKTHDNKCWVQFFDLIRSGVKTFDLRQDDRHYEVGDKVIFNEFRHRVGEYTGRKLERTICYIARGEPFDVFGLKPGFVVLGLKAE